MFRFDLLREAWIIERDNAGISFHRTCGQHKRRPGLEEHRAVFMHAANADFGPLNISHNRDLITQPAQAFTHRAVPFVLAMRKIEPGHIHAGIEELRQTFLGIAHQADGANDLGAARGLLQRYFADEGGHLISKGLALNNVVIRPFVHGFDDNPN